MEYEIQKRSASSSKSSTKRKRVVFSDKKNTMSPGSGDSADSSPPPPKRARLSLEKRFVMEGAGTVCLEEGRRTRSARSSNLSK